MSDEGDGPPTLKSLTWASRDVEIGVSIRDQDAGAKSAGAVVDEVRQDSPAAKAGVKAGDSWWNSMANTCGAPDTSRLG